MRHIFSQVVIRREHQHRATECIKKGVDGGNSLLFFKLSLSFRMKAVVALKWKNVARQKQICRVSDYKVFVLWQLRLNLINTLSQFKKFQALQV